MSGFIWAVNGGGDIVALPDPLNAYRRPSLVGTSWNEVRLGILEESPSFLRGIILVLEGIPEDAE